MENRGTQFHPPTKAGISIKAIRVAFMRENPENKFFIDKAENKNASSFQKLLNCLLLTHKAIQQQNVSAIL
jgi:hypothetical protein